MCDAVEYFIRPCHAGGLQIFQIGAELLAGYRGSIAPCQPEPLVLRIVFQFASTKRRSGLLCFCFASFQHSRTRRIGKFINQRVAFQLPCFWEKAKCDVRISRSKQVIRQTSLFVLVFGAVLTMCSKKLFNEIQCVFFFHLVSPLYLVERFKVFYVEVVEAMSGWNA